MIRFAFNRLGLMIPTFIGVTIIAFSFIRLLPGDPILAAAITDIGLVVAATLPLLLAALALWRLRDAGQELDTLNQILVEELVAEQPRLLPPPPPSRDALPCLSARSESDVEPPF